MRTSEPKAALDQYGFGIGTLARDNNGALIFQQEGLAGHGR